MTDITKAYSLETRKIIPQPYPYGGAISGRDFPWEHVSKGVYATGMRNIMAYGFLPSKELADAMSQRNYDGFMSTYNDCIELAKAATGSEMADARIFYSGFPDTVLELTDAEMFIDQIMSYFNVALFGEDLIPEDRAVDRDPLFEKFDREPKIIGLGSNDDLKRFYEARIWSNNSLSDSKMAETVGYMKETKDWRSRLAKEPVPNKENASRIALAIDSIEPERKKRLWTLDRLLATPVDVLRYAALLSNGKQVTVTEKNKQRKLVWGKKSRREARYEWRTQVTKKDEVIENRADLSGKVRFKLSTSEAHTVKTLLANKPSLFTDMWMRKELFKNLAKSVSMKDKTPARLKQAYDRLCANERVNEAGNRIMSVYGRMEDAFGLYDQTGDVVAFLGAAKKAPGVFSRNYLRAADAVIRKVPAERRTEELTRLSNVYADSCSSVPVREQLKLINLINTQPDQDARYIYESKITKYVKTDVPETRKSLSAYERTVLGIGVSKSVENALKQETPLGKVYIAPETYKFLLPENGERASSKGSILTSGSRIRLYDEKEANIVRPFIWWTNLEDGGRVDLDLSATFMDKDMIAIGGCSYCQQRYAGKGDSGYIAISSGDCTDGGSVDGKGAGEFLDIDRGKLKENGIKYVAFSVHGYTNQNFDQMKNVKFGYMQREGSLGAVSYDKDRMEPGNLFETGNGKAYELSTVDFCCDLNYKGTEEVMAILDVDKGELVWVDRPLIIGRGLHNSVNEIFLEQAEAQARTILSPVTPTIGQLFEAHANVRGEITYDIHDADLVILPKPADAAELGIKETAKVITAYDIGIISSEFMKAYKPVKDENRHRDDREEREMYDETVLCERGEDVPETDVMEEEFSSDFEL